jgi:hypothetical protein
MADEEPDIRTYSLPEVAKMILPDMTSGVRWLSNRLNRGELSGYRVGRTWRMTREDVADMIERHRTVLFRESAICDRVLLPRPRYSSAEDADTRISINPKPFDVDGILMLVRREERNCPSAAVLSVELPGIEPVAKCALTCGNVEVDYAKRRQTTCGYAGSVDGINSAPQSLSVPQTMPSPTTLHTLYRA